MILHTNGVGVHSTDLKRKNHCGLHEHTLAEETSDRLIEPSSGNFQYL